MREFEDYDASVSWFSRAADLGEAEAQYNLGTMFLSGVGVARDRERARECFRRAAEQGHERRGRG